MELKGFGGGGDDATCDRGIVFVCFYHLPSHGLKELINTSVFTYYSSCNKWVYELCAVL